MRPRSTPSLALRIALLGALLLGLAGGAIALRLVVAAKMTEVRSSILTYLQERLGRSISYGQVSPSIFGQLAITELKVYSADDPSRVILSVDRLRASYSLLRLLITGDPVHALREIDLSDSVLTLDVRADHELATVAKNLVSGAGKVPDSASTKKLTPFPIRVSGNELQVRLVSQQLDLGLNGLFFTVSANGQSLSVTLRCGIQASLALPGPLGGEVSAKLSIAGKAATDLSWADLQLQIRSFTHERIALRDQMFLFSYRDGLIRVTKIEDRAPVDLELTVGTVSRTARLTFLADGLEPKDLFSLRGDWSRYGEWLTAPVSARGSVSVGLDGTGLAYDVEIRTVVAPAALPAPFAVSARARGDASTLTVQELTADSPVGSLGFAGDVDLQRMLPQGVLTVNGFQSLLGRPLTGTLRLERPAAVERSKRTVAVTADSLRLGDLSASDVHGEIDLDGGTARLGLTMRSGRGGRASLDGKLAWSPSVRVEADGELSGLSLASLATALLPNKGKAVPPSFAAYTVSGALHFDTDLKSFSLDMPAVSMTDPANAANRARAAIKVSNDAVSIRAFDAAYLGQELSGDAEVKLRDARAVGFTSSFAVNGVPFDVQGSLEANELRFNGSYNIQGALVFFPFESSGQDTYFWVSSGTMPVPVKGLPITASVSLKGVFPEGQDWFISSDDTHATFTIPGTSAPIQADASFTLNRKGMAIDRLTLADPVSTLTGAGAVDITDLAAPAVSLNLRLRGPSGAEQYLVSGELSPARIQLKADVSGSPLVRLGQKLITGTIRGSAEVSGPPSAPALVASFVLENGRFNRDPVTLSSDVTVSGQRFELRNTRFTLGDHRVSEGTATVDMGAGSFRIGCSYDALLLSDQVHTHLDASGTLEGYGLPEIAALAFPNAVDAVFTVSSATVNGKDFPPWSVQFRSEGDRLRFYGGPGGILVGSLGRDRKFSVRLNEPYPLVGSMGGTLEGSKIDASLQVDRFDVSVLSSLLKSDIIKFTRGTAASTPGSISIRGPLNDPDIVGSIRVTGAGIRTPLSPDEGTPVNTWINFGPSPSNDEEKAFVLDQVTTPMGKGRLTAVAQFTLDHWAPTAIDLRLTAEAPEGVHVVWRFGTLAVDGYVRGTIRVVHDGTRTQVTSDDLVLQSSKLNMDFSNSGEEGGAPPPLGVDLRITTGKNVQFTWPRQALPILKATARQGSVVKVSYDGEGGELVMDGDVAVLGGDLFYFDRSFSIREGSIAFHENALQFDPRVSMRAEIRERDSQNQDIRIFLVADRVRLSEFSPQTITFSSDPALPSAVILERIGRSLFSRTGAPAAETTGGTGTAALPLVATLTGDVISQIGILSPVEDRVREFLGLDLVSIRTQIVQNFLVDKIDQFLTPTRALDNPGPALGKYFGNTELTIGKYIGDDLFLEMMLRLQTADAGIQSGVVGLTGLSPAFEISLEWDTPFFILDWSFLPQHPEDLFLSDNTLGVRWRISY